MLPSRFTETVILDTTLALVTGEAIGPRLKSTGSEEPAWGDNETRCFAPSFGGINPSL
jgi:hypothetical protein